MVRTAVTYAQRTSYEPTLKDLPENFATLREKMFRLAHTFANLPESSKQTVTRPETSYLFGWSHGREVMNGVSRYYIGFACQG
jgi:hypothetical protein